MLLLWALKGIEHIYIQFAKAARKMLHWSNVPLIWNLYYKSFATLTRFFSATSKIKPGA
jgi:hypothetical protein